MKIHALLLLLVVVAVVNATSVAFRPLPGPPEDEPDCTGESLSDRWRQDCNWCSCRNGRGTCTRRLCIEGQEDPEPECEGNPTWKRDCNTCDCVDGIAICTSEYCDGEPGPVMTMTVDQQSTQCEEGSRWRDACNWCMCEGGQSRCTKAACPNWSELQAVEEGIVECHGDARWKKDCNWCTCVNGRGICTTRACIPPEHNLFHNLPEHAVCVPGSRYKIECNWCNCAENGMALCTLMGCLPGFKDDGPTCEEGSVWKSDDCNLCRCIKGASACTKRLCRDTPPQQETRSGVRTEEEEECQGEGERARWRQDCNWCRCRDGVGACTRRLCPEGLQIEGPECEGDVSWKKGCNRCRCINGTAVCTSAFCGPLSARPSIHRVAVTREPECQGEGEGDRWRQDCNWCRCLDGIGVCTRRLCPEGQEDESPECEGNVSWKKGCNKCHCVNGAAVCTSAFCGPLPARPAVNNVAVTREPECQGEGEGDRWRQDCNWCRCLDGVGVCTKRLCPEGQRDEGPECEGNVAWTKDCNKCRCVNGIAICTTAFCGPLPARPSFTRVGVRDEPECEGEGEGDRWRQDCNWCRCRDGVGACTKRLCPEGQPDELPECEGSVSWKKDCNKCHCVDGMAICTSANCDGPIGPVSSVSVMQTKTSKPVCVDGSRWRVNCNWCSCHNGMAACTEKACLGQIADNQQPECEGNSTWKNDCNWCTCGDGLALCTRMACLKKTEDVCTEGVSWRENCNICRCSQGFVMCTKRLCITEDQKPKCQGDSCGRSELPELCNLPPISGNLQCTGFFMKWSFSSTAGKCQQIVYGGCAGTANLFDSQKECEAACPSSATPQNRRFIPLPKAVSSGGGRCTLPKEQGPCFAAFQRYAYNAVTGACELFLYGGCGGNANNFVTEEECVSACQGTQATTCDKSKCPWNLWGHYLAKECVPQYAGDACCPTSFQCPSASESGKDPTQCHYNGQPYNVGDHVPVTDPCSASCYCRESTGNSGVLEITCANVECPELFRPPTPGCRPLYRADRCCPYDYDCVDPSTPPLEPRAATCAWQNKTYLDGDKMYFDEHPCRACICGPGFTDPNGPGCYNIDCGLTFRYNAEYSQGCSPIFFEEDGCCPIDFMCPDDSRIELQQQQQQPGTVDESSVCRLGDRQFAVGEMLGVTDCKIECRCVTPPELTCVQHRTCEGAQEAAAGRECPTLECGGEGCRAVVAGPSQCPTCSCSPDTYTCPTQTCPSNCQSEVDLETGCPSCKCQCPSEVPCPMDCAVHTIMDEATGCPRCECQPHSSKFRSSCPEYPSGRVPCPQDCAVITKVDENGCERCECDPNDTTNPFVPPLLPRNPACRTAPDGRAPCPMDCAIIRFTDDNGCEVCKCDPDNPGNPFGPYGPPPPPPHHHKRRSAGLA